KPNSRLSMIGIELDGLMIGLQRFVDLLLCEEDLSELKVTRGVKGMKLQLTFKLPLGLLLGVTCRRAQQNVCEFIMQSNGGGIGIQREPELLRRRGIVFLPLQEMAQHFVR